MTATSSNATYVIRMRFIKNGVEQFSGNVPVTLPPGADLYDLRNDLRTMENYASTRGRSLSLVIDEQRDTPPPPMRVEPAPPVTEPVTDKPAKKPTKAKAAKPGEKTTGKPAKKTTGKPAKPAKKTTGKKAQQELDL